MIRGVKEVIRRALPRRASPHRIWSGPLSGRSIVTSWHDYPAAILGLTERGLIAWLRQNVRRGETWLDIGAHYGYTTIALGELVGEMGRVFAFEPMLATAGCLRETLARNHLGRLTVLPFALGDVDSIEMRRVPTVRGMADMTAAQISVSESVLMSSLAWAWPRICGGDPKLHGIKIDVQGMEVEVLRGMMGILASRRPALVLEFHVGVDRDAILELLLRCSYDLPGKAVDGDEQTAAGEYLDNRSYAFVGGGGERAGA